MYYNLSNPYQKIYPFITKKYVQRFRRKLRIGFIRQIINVKASPASKRALQQTTQILRRLGHDVFEIRIPNEKQLVREYLLEINASAPQYLREILKGEKPTIQNEIVLKIHQLKTPLRFLFAFYAKIALQSVYYFTFSKKLKTIYDYQNHVGYVQQLKKEWIQFWMKQKLDFAISIGYPCQAFLHGISNSVGFGLAYAFIWNLLDMTVGSLPVTVVRQEQQFYAGKNEKIFVNEMRKCVENSKGLPVGIQVVGLPYAQEEVLNLMLVLEKEIKFYQRNPLPNHLQPK